jgi:hypothetical protein
MTAVVSAVGCIGLFGRDVLREDAERATLTARLCHRGTGN